MDSSYQIILHNFKKSINQIYDPIPLFRFIHIANTQNKKENEYEREEEKVPLFDLKAK